MCIIRQIRVTWQRQKQWPHPSWPQEQQLQIITDCITMQPHFLLTIRTIHTKEHLCSTILVRIRWFQLVLILGYKNAYMSYIDTHFYISSLVGGSSLMDEDQHIDLEERTNGNNGTTATKEPSLTIANKSLWNCCPMCARNQNASRQGHQGTIVKWKKFVLII